MSTRSRCCSFEVRAYTNDFSIPSCLLPTRAVKFDLVSPTFAEARLRKVPQPAGDRASLTSRACFTRRADHGIGESDINPLSLTPLSHTVRGPGFAVAQPFSFYSCTPKCAAMDSSRKRKATNATPSQPDGSATKKIKLVVRVSLAYTLFIAMDRVRGSRAGGWRIGVCV